VLDFEQGLAELVRELARGAVEFAYNHLEGDQPEELPHHLQHEAGQYRRLNRKTANREVATLFGKITLYRHGYRYLQRDVAEPAIFPLEIQLGLVEGATPALASVAAKALAEAGATQEVALARLRQQHGVQWGVKKLRAVAEKLSAGMEHFRREHQAKQVVGWLRQAYASSGRHRPALALGRDGITLCTSPHSFYEVATTATLSIYDRCGNRLGTVYLAYAPELGQQTMTDELTALLLEVLRQWEGPLPRLAYITDAGANETQYPRKVLNKLRHPRTGQRLCWQWIVDYYHASQRLTTMAEATQRPLPGVAFGGRPAFASRHVQAGTPGLSDRLQLSADAHQAHAVPRLPGSRASPGQRRYGGRLQDRVHAATQALGHALVKRRRPGDP